MASYLVWAVLLLAAYSKADKIGTPASIYDYPGIAQVEIGLPGLIWTQQCAATIITSWHLLSVASCFLGATEYRRIRAGTETRSSGGYLSYVASANNHPDHEFDADICVVRVLTQLPLGDTIQQTAILGQGITLPTGLPVGLLGWGTTAEGGSVSSPQLYSLDLLVTDPDSCAITYLDEKTVTENNICVGLTILTGRDYDARDMGDPLYYQNVLVGLLSHGRKESEDEYPIVSTLISSYTDWIIANAV
ncbi:hypothetical protein K1T71_012363 [Dendrolimus kikuchii]|uniref:Uncharacterized protein n=1 Tax=Dendrolimus kikuchii TaxID=765133 RepID=A0ACC1CLK5_9NEOP|nr:hypothetical protein K1T71_012363 [Dendrolimus kikuchii]